MDIRKFIPYTEANKKYKAEQENEKKLASMEAEQQARREQAQKAFKSDEFITILSEHPDFEPDMIDDIETDPDTAEFISTRFEVFKEKKNIVKEFTSVYEEAFRAELESAGITKPEALGKDFWDKVNAEINKEIRGNPEGLLDLYESLKEHAQNQKQIVALERELKKLNAPTAELQEHMETLKGLAPEQILANDKLTPEQRLALKELGKYFKTENSVQILAKTYRALDDFAKMEQAAIATDKLDDLKDQALDLRAVILEQENLRTILNNQLDAAHNKHYADLVSKIDAGKQEDLEAYLDYANALNGQSSEFGSFERKVESLAQGGKSGEEILTKAAEAVQKYAEDKFKEEVIAAVQQHQTFNQLNVHLAHILTTTRIGAKTGLDNTRAQLETIFAEIYRAPSTTKDQKTHLRIYLKKHNLNGKL